jgi:hypothetical protein
MISSQDLSSLNRLVTKDRNAILKGAGFAGTDNACNTLFTVGRAVGNHFNLLNDDGSPTQLYEDTFDDLMDELNEELNEAIQKLNDNNS